MRRSRSSASLYYGRIDMRPPSGKARPRASRATSRPTRVGSSALELHDHQRQRSMASNAGGLPPESKRWLRRPRRIQGGMVRSNSRVTTPLAPQPPVTGEFPHTVAAAFIGKLVVAPTTAKSHESNVHKGVLIQSGWRSRRSWHPGQGSIGGVGCHPVDESERCGPVSEATGKRRSTIDSELDRVQ